MLISVSNPTPKGEKMYFYNACGLIKFTIPENRTNITKVAFRGSNEEKLAGRIKISYGTTGVTSVFQERYIGQKSTNTLTLSNVDGSVLTPGTYYMVATPTKLEKGFTIAMYGSDGKRYIKSSEATTNEIERSGILDLGTLSFGESAPAHSKIFFISEGDNWSFVEMTRHLAFSTAFSTRVTGRIPTSHRRVKRLSLKISTRSWLSATTASEST